MPVSNDYAIPRLLWVVKNLQPKRTLDVGCGTGKYGVFFRFALEESLPESEWSNLVIDGLDAYLPNPTHWHAKYQQISVADVAKAAATLPAYDLIFLGDVIEHFEKPEGEALLKALCAKASMGVLLATPFHFMEQGSLGGNPFERHRSLWTASDFRRFPYQRMWVEYRKVLIALVSDHPLPNGKSWDAFRGRSWLSSLLERAAFRVLGLSRARRLKSILTGVPVQ